ncbi:MULTISPECIES: hypothetical protein [unclassified Psychrobacter]|uniref:hypothetical protein n=1 Tax=unclassified Psychrobacter TaxID=196806 RepID=UPI000ECE21E0|nr:MULTISPECIES: hypothetical protein [unclassified Psychrobacter]MBE8608622.1 hypothetical protein [Pseudomonas lundensis]HCI75208.1 hypothetical protein [Psychrobacter sp.]
MPNSIRTTSNTQTNSTPAHQALNGSHDDGLSIVLNKKCKVIDLTNPNDDEVILIPSRMLSDIACDIDGAATALYDVGQLLALMHYDKIEAHTIPALEHLAHDATDTWASLLYEQLESINDTLAMTGYGKEGSQ